MGTIGTVIKPPFLFGMEVLCIIWGARNELYAFCGNQLTGMLWRILQMNGVG